MSENPDYIIYQVTFNPHKQKPVWHKIGVAFSHIDGEGYDLHMNSFPISGSVVMRKAKKNGFREKKGEAVSLGL